MVALPRDGQRLPDRRSHRLPSRSQPSYRLQRRDRPRPEHRPRWARCSGNGSPDIMYGARSSWCSGMGACSIVPSSAAPIRMSRSTWRVCRRRSPPPASPRSCAPDGFRSTRRSPSHCARFSATRAARAIRVSPRVTIGQLLTHRAGFGGGNGRPGLGRPLVRLSARQRRIGAAEPTILAGRCRERLASDPGARFHLQQH